jgi:F0F1-type ATP synthase assembly protein I
MLLTHGTSNPHSPDRDSNRMADQQRNLRELGFYYSLAQVGLEMVVPAGLGAVLDHYLEIRPWGVIVGAVLGFVVGLIHLIALVERQNKRNVADNKEQKSS